MDDEEEVLREGWLDKRAGLIGYGSRWFRLSRDVSGRHYLRYAWNPSRGWRRELSLEGAIIREGESTDDGITVTTKDQAPEPGQGDGMSTNSAVTLQLRAPSPHVHHSWINLLRSATHGVYDRHAPTLIAMGFEQGAVKHALAYFSDPQAAADHIVGQQAATEPTDASRDEAAGATVAVLAPVATPGGNVVEPVPSAPPMPRSVAPPAHHTSTGVLRPPDNGSRGVIEYAERCQWERYMCEELGLPRPTAKRTCANPSIMSLDQAIDAALSLPVQQLRADNDADPALPTAPRGAEPAPAVAHQTPSQARAMEEALSAMDSEEEDEDDGMMLHVHPTLSQHERSGVLDPQASTPFDVNNPFAIGTNVATSRTGKPLSPVGATASGGYKRTVAQLPTASVPVAARVPVMPSFRRAQSFSHPGRAGSPRRGLASSQGQVLAQPAESVSVQMPAGDLCRELAALGFGAADARQAIEDGRCTTVSGAIDYILAAQHAV